MKTSISTLSVADALEDKLAAFAAAGFDSIEITEQDFAVQGRTPTEIGQMVRDQGLSIRLFKPALDFEGLPEASRRRAFDRIERRFNAMAELGTDLLLICSATSPDCLGGVDRMANDFTELGELAQKYGMRVGYEALAWGRHISDYRDAWEVVRRANHPAIGLVLDSYHTLARGLSSESIRAIPADKLFHVQLADAPAVSMDLQYKSRNFRSLPGEGDFPILDFVKAVAATGYSDGYGLDLVENKSRASTRQLALDGYRALIVIADAARKSEPSCHVDLPPMPQKAKIEGVEFIEFAAGDKDAPSMEAMLSQLGFKPTAKHIARKVTLWQQNGINIVINSETKGYAHSAYVMHGTSVCDIGLMVGDAEAATVRSELLGAKRFMQKRHSGELDIPAMRGVGGSVLHFLDRQTELGEVWEKEFVPVTDESNVQPTGLLRIDHLAQVMKQEELNSWTQFYTSIFNINKAPDVGVADAGGLVQSRSLQNADGSFRLTMNGVDTHRTFAGRFLSDSYGASMQHFAFLSGNIIDTARKLAANGFESLEIPETYYDELATEFELGPEVIETLRARNIFYDQDDNGGSFLQLYSRPHGDGFFFEVVERRGGYNGYGARNAPYRTAALKRLAR
ncbi:MULTISPECIES: bifunctional sugar phosphate isomerase/epimerase/4-hydroxyphenylpyruvate dioxygenase family protein [Cohaesibacter]|uniref:bifunctional sugar phosphate isomerase/epimerase/4-hydroxyphenylpyruvate dioxygenase family protein n=1 Tax=Cohaesibacter TaxID=655352 RepID=UPI000DEAAC0B|nr:MULTISPECIES: sugar phosphate isomerase/epimerase and 4-hydroxyphenylpyruvate domain-containing protein [Cohaesibacter]TLP48401.1 sugar phosphate isomerase/epimerase and 4-hydroxyphenylpyruvate domain-containing protein [Cohaesibacter sp. CAU 1516]